jgi:hypothetical protein
VYLSVLGLENREKCCFTAKIPNPEFTNIARDSAKGGFALMKCSLLNVTRQPAFSFQLLEVPKLKKFVHTQKVDSERKKRNKKM